VQQRECALVEKNYGGGACDEAHDEPARELGARRVVMQGMSVHVTWTRSAAVQFITPVQAC
jgi:hypothetical protein